jgi:hypothetical protein
LIHDGSSAKKSLISGLQIRNPVSVDWNRSKGRIMNRSIIGVALCLAAALTSVTSYAGDHRKGSRDHRHHGSAMQVIAVAANPGEPGHGWQYFSDARRGRAVVISPGGDYYYSYGEGPALVYRASAAA